MVYADGKDGKDGAQTSWNQSGACLGKTSWRTTAMMMMNDNDDDDAEAFWRRLRAAWRLGWAQISYFDILHDYMNSIYENSYCP